MSEKGLCLGRVTGDSIAETPGRRTLRGRVVCDQADLWCLTVGWVPCNGLLWRLEY